MTDARIQAASSALPPPLQPNPEADPRAWQQALQAMQAYVADPGFPCIGAKSAFNTGRFQFALLGPLGHADSAAGLCEALYRFIAAYPEPGVRPVTFVAAFDSRTRDELRFEELLWRQLQAAHELDRLRYAWDPRVASDPQDPDFSCSIGGHGFFVVGLHPSSSRIARRAPTDTLIFNFNAQFKALSSAGKYDTMEHAVRERDLALQGSLNPVLARHGEASEARQYSGRPVGDHWKCPFHARTPQ